MNAFEKIIHDAEQALTSLLGTDVTISVSLSKKAMHGVEYKWDVKQSQIDKLIFFVCKEFNLNPDHFTSDKSKSTRQETDARSVFCLLAKKHLNCNDYLLASIMKRGRSNVFYTLQRINDLISVNDPITKKISIIENNFLTKTNNNHEGVD